MLIDYKLGQTSVILRVKVRLASTGLGMTGLANSSAGLIISTIADNEASATAYTQAGSTIDTITTLGTFGTITAGHCQFKKVDDTNHPGIVEIQIANARFAVAGAKSLLVSWSGVSGMADADCLIPLRSIDQYDGVRAGLTALPNVAAGASGGLPTGDASGRVLLQPTQTGVTIPTVTTVGTLTTYTGNTVQTGDAYARLGAPTGASIAADIQTRSTYAGGAVASVTGAVGSVTGAVGSVTGNVGGNVVGTVASVVGAVASVTGSVGSVVGAVGSVTGAVGSVTGNVGGSVGSVTAAVTLPTIPTDWLTAAGVKADAVTKIQAGLSTYAGADTAGTTTLLSRVTAAVALASQIPANFTTACFASAGVFSVGALANAPSGTGASAVSIRQEIDANSTQLASLVTGQGILASGLSGVPAAVWASTTRTLSAFGFTVTANPVTIAAASSPASGVTVAGSTASSVVASGLPSGRNYVGQHLYHQASGEARTIAAQSFAASNYTFTFGTGSGESGPFSVAPSAGDLLYPVA